MSAWNWCRGAQNNNAPVNVKPQDRGAEQTQGDCHSTWPAAVQNYWNKRTFLNKKRVQSPQDRFGTPTWPLFYCFWTPTWQTWRRVKTLYNFPGEIHWCQIPLPWGYFLGGGLDNFIIWSKFFFLFIGQESTMWPANNCLQIMTCSCAMSSKRVWVQIRFCSCIKETTLFSFEQSLLRENGKSLRFPGIFINK